MSSLFVTCLTLNIVSVLAYVITLSQLFELLMTFSQVCHTLTAMLRNTISFYNCPCIILYLKWFDKKNWDIEDGEASEQLHQKRNSFYLEITLEVSFFFSFEKKEFHKASMDDFKSSVYSFAKIIFFN